MPKYKIDSYAMFATEGGSRVGKITGIYKPQGSEDWRYIFECEVVVNLEGKRPTKVTSYYTVKEWEIEPLT